MPRGCWESLSARVKQLRRGPPGVPTLLQHFAGMMRAMTALLPVRWYSSFYWRIGISFVVFVVVVQTGSMTSSSPRSNGFARAWSSALRPSSAS